MVMVFSDYAFNCDCGNSFNGAAATQEIPEDNSCIILKCPSCGKEAMRWSPATTP